MSDLGPIVVRRTVTAPQQRVWQLLVDDAERASWWPDLELQPEVGGAVANGDLTGAVDVVVNDLTLGFRWRRPDDEADRTVVMMLRPEDDNFGHTRITVIESGFAVLPDAAEAVESATEAWEARYDALNLSTEPVTNDDEHAGAEAADHGADEDSATDHTGEASVLLGEGAPDDDTAVVADEDAPEGATAETARAMDIEAADEAFETTADIDGDSDGDRDSDVDADRDLAETITIEVGAHDDADVIDALSYEVNAPAGDVDTGFAEHDMIEIITDDVIDAETIEPSEGIYLPEVSGAPFTESTVQITADLGVNEPVEVDETSEWERLLRGDDLDEQR